MQHEALDDTGEMNKRYGNTYVGVFDDGIEYPMKVSEFYRDDDSSVIMMRSQGGSVHKLNEVNLTRPQLGAFNVGKAVVFLTIPAIRQWKRGFVFKHAKIDCRFHKELGAAHHRLPSNTAILKSIYNPKYPSVEEALSEVRGFNTVACAFSNKFYFGMQYNASEILVFYKKWIVGYVNDDDVIMLKSHHLFEELSQYIKVRKVE